MSEVRDYLEPENVNNVYLPSRDFYVMDGTQKMKSLSYQLFYDNENDYVGLKGELPDGTQYHSSYNVTVDYMERTLIWCCDTKTLLQQLDEIKEVMDEVLNMAFEELDNNKIIEVGHEIKKDKVEGFIKRIDNEAGKNKEYGHLFNNITLALRDYYGDKPRFEGKIEEAMPIHGEEKSESIIHNPEDLVIEFVDRDGEKYQVYGIEISSVDDKKNINDTKLKEIRFTASGCSLDYTDKPDDILEIPANKAGEAKKGSRLGNIVVREHMSEFIERVRKKIGEETDNEKSKKRKKESRSKKRFNKIT